MALPAGWFSISNLQPGKMELDHPPKVLVKFWQSHNLTNLGPNSLNLFSSKLKNEANKLVLVPYERKACQFKKALAYWVHL